MIKFIIALFISCVAFADSSPWGSIVGNIQHQSDLQTEFGLKAPLASPTFTGSVTAPTYYGDGSNLTGIITGVSWGSITGTLSNQTDLATALGLKANISSLATVATSGHYSDLIGVPTLLSQFTNDSMFITSSQAPVQSVAGRMGTVTLTSSDVGLGNVNNTSDANKPVSTATQTALNLKYDVSNPAGYISSAPVASVFGRVGTITATSGDYTTSQVNEGSNLDFTTARAQGAISATSPLVDTAGVISIPKADATHNGYLSSTDWSAFSNGAAIWGNITGTLSSQTDLATALAAKEPSITSGTTSQYWRGDKSFQTLNTTAVPEGSNLYYTDARAQAATSATSPLVDTAGVFSIPVATSSANGYLSSTDWTTFNAKQPAGNYITALTGDVVATGPGSVASTIQTNVVSNSKLAQMPTNTLKGNNTGSTANATDLTVANVTAMLNTFVGDSGSGGTQGLVPAPTIYTGEQGYVLGAGGSFAANDTQKPLSTPFKFLSTTPSLTQKLQNILMIQNGASTYAIAGGGTTQTISIFNVTDQAKPVLRGSKNISGTYGACGSNASWPYIFVPASGARTLSIINIQDPNNPVTTATFSWSANTTSIYNCAYSNGLVFMAGQNHGLGILDVGNGVSGGTITAPVLAYDEGTQSICSVTNSCKSFGLALDATNQIVYITDFSTATPWTYRQLKAYSYASSITSPTLLQNLTLPAATKPTGLSLNLGTKTAFSVDGNTNTVQIIDLTNVSTGGMTYLSSMTPTYTMNSANSAFAVSGSNYAYIPGGSTIAPGGIDLFDLTNRSSPVKVSTSLLTGVATSVFGMGAIDPRGGYIYIGDYGTGTTGSGLDIFSMPYESMVAGNATINNLTVVGTLTAPAVATATRTSTIATSITTADRFLNMNSSSSVAVTLPSAATAGQVYTITNINTGVATVSGADLINGQSSITLNNGDSMSIVSIAGVWNIW